MNQAKLYTKHLIASFIFLIIWIGILFLSYDFIQDILTNPLSYFPQSFTVLEAYSAMFFSCLAIIIVLASFIFYLLLTYRTRFEREIWNATKSVELSGEQFKKLYDDAPMPYLMLGENAAVHNPNMAALRFFGVTAAEIEDKNIFSFVAGDFKDQAEMLSGYYKAGVPIDKKDLQLLTKKGAVKSVLLSVLKMEGRESYSNNKGLAMIFDVTEQKLLDKAKTEFLSLASHQLRTPLATTNWYTEMMLSGDLGELNEKQKDYTKRLNVVNKDMIELVDVLLNVSRMELGALPVDRKITNVEEISESILSELSSQIEKKEIKIKKNYNNSLQSIQSDPKLLRIVIQNIISNAVKYTVDGGTVTITFEESNRAKKVVVSDTGIGIPKEEQANIFHKLYRAKNARDFNNSQGTGLGLYLVKSIIESMGGYISFTSEENKGTTFTLTL